MTAVALISSPHTLSSLPATSVTVVPSSTAPSATTRNATGSALLMRQWSGSTEQITFGLPVLTSCSGRSRAAASRARSPIKMSILLIDSKSCGNRLQKQLPRQVAATHATHCTHWIHRIHGRKNGLIGYVTSCSVANCTHCLSALSIIYYAIVNLVHHTHNIRVSVLHCRRYLRHLQQVCVVADDMYPIQATCMSPVWTTL